MNEAPTAQEIRITRVFDAPRALVWQAWTDPEHLARWWGPRGRTTPVDSITLELRPGGTFRVGSVSDEHGDDMVTTGTFREVVEPERLVFTISDQPGDERFELCTVVLTDLGDGRTEMRFSQRGEMTPEQYERAGSGWGVFFDRMDERLAGA
jgi:uncharacterized protein YndB with AHSA1/START domain